MWARVVFYIIFGFLGLFLETGRYRRNDYSNRYDNDPLNIDVTGGITNFFKRRNRRITALKEASMYLKPYEKIFGNLCLSNKFCTLNLIEKEKTILCISSVFNANGRKMLLAAKNFSPMDIDEYWDTICALFSWNTNYDDIHKSLAPLSIISESVLQMKPVTENAQTAQIDEQLRAPENVIQINPQLREMLDTPQNLLDINNCSEAEITALPGISIVMSKKIIKFREEERPFKSVDDFLQIMKIKPHFAKQLKDMICTNNINVRKIKRAKAERIIDL